MFAPEAHLRIDRRGELTDAGVRGEMAELLDTLAGVLGGVTLAA